jgi:hypothetical protein
MKKLLLFLTLCSIGFCDEEINYAEEDSAQDEIVFLDTNIKPTPPPQIQRQAPTTVRNRFTYVRLGPSNSSFSKEIFPSMALGRRFEIPKSAIDLSAGFGYLGKTFSNSHSYYAYLPKIMYLRYADQEHENTFFYGSGMSFFTSASDARASKFFGIAAHISAGYEFGRYDRIRQLTQLDISQPILPAYSKGNFPLPVIELSAGVGF